MQSIDKSSKKRHLLYEDAYDDHAENIAFLAETIFITFNLFS